MARVALDLGDKKDLQLIAAAGWRMAPGLVPGEPNQGLVAELMESPARLPVSSKGVWCRGVPPTRLPLS